MKLDTLPTWSMVAADGHRRRGELFHHVRHWAALAHARNRGYTTTRTIAALDILTRPMRTRLVDFDTGSTDRDRAEAAADDLWDACAVVYALVASVKGKDLAALEHVLAELAECGRWLAAYPVTVARHDQEIARLFDQ
jgi:hypothetical protein